MWNYPPVLIEDDESEEELYINKKENKNTNLKHHKFRTIADPKGSYVDGRIEELEELIIFLANKL